MSPNPTRSLYLDLPVEIRLQILDFVIPSSFDHPILVAPNLLNGVPLKFPEAYDENNDDENSTTITTAPHLERFRIPPIAQVDRLLRPDALRLYFRNTFQIAIFNLDPSFFAKWSRLIQSYALLHPPRIHGLYYAPLHPDPEHSILRHANKWASLLWHGDIPSMPPSAHQSSFASQLAACMNAAAEAGRRQMLGTGSPAVGAADDANSPHREATPPYSFAAGLSTALNHTRTRLLEPAYDSALAALGMRYPAQFWTAYEEVEDTFELEKALEAGLWRRRSLKDRVPDEEEINKDVRLRWGRAGVRVYCYAPFMRYSLGIVDQVLAGNGKVVEGWVVDGMVVL